MKTLRNTLLFAVCAMTAAGCVVGLGGTGDDTVNPPGDDDDQPPPPPPPPVPTTAVYHRGSLPPLYGLTPRGEYTRFTETGVSMVDADFVSNANNFVSVQQKLDELSAQITTENGTTVNIIPAVDRDRAQRIPFRGKPSDVKFATVDGRDQIYVPLGGDLMTPGNEVAIVNRANNSVQRVKVGIRPQRLAVHPEGLIFVCNQYSNYISIIDPRTSQLFLGPDGKPVEIKTEFYCSDLLFVDQSIVAPDPEHEILYVSNSWRASVLRYDIDVTENAISGDPESVTVVHVPSGGAENAPTAEIAGVGATPYRLSLGQDKKSIFVTNGLAGEVAKIDLATSAVKRIAFNTPVSKVVQFNNQILASCQSEDRGLPDEDGNADEITVGPLVVNGMDNQPHVAHPGALFDDTKAYNFQDLRNGMIVGDASLNSASHQYFTDANSPEDNFVNQQKILRGTLPGDIQLTKDRRKAFISMEGNDTIQVLNLSANAFALSDNGLLIQTDKRPFAIALDEDEQEVLSAALGGEVLEIFDINNGNRKARIDLGYATLAYPGTNNERGEYLFYNTEWSNNGDMSCASCHRLELLSDGIPFANGATAPTAYHQVTPNFNLMTTDAYFWNGSFSQGTYASLAADAQTRTNCELILFGLVEGIDSDPNGRVGDPANRVNNANDAQCRPDTDTNTVLPANFAQIAQVIEQQKLVRDDVVVASTADVGGLDFHTVSRQVDFYSVSELRLPPDPLTFLYKTNALSSTDKAKIDEGKALFEGSAACATCHPGNNSRHPYADGLEHGRGVTWRQQFVDFYSNDARLLAILPAGIPEAMTQTLNASTAGSEINVHLDPIDYFRPFCFDLDHCLTFDDPLAARGNAAREGDLLTTLVLINLANVDRGFVPGNVTGYPAVNTPSLRGMWWSANYLRHGLARSMSESILAPGHPALKPGENGFAIDVLGQKDVHGLTSTLTEDQVDALNLYVESIE